MKKKYKTFDRKRPVSWSFISSFEWSPEQWYQTYVLGIRQSSRQMEFGSYVDKRLQDDPTFLPEVVRYQNLQHKMLAKLGKVPLIGLTDAYRPKIINSGGVSFTKKTATVIPAHILSPAIRDYKTGVKAWTQARADETGQLTMYCLLLWLTEKVRPEDVELYIDWLPTKEMGDYTIGFRDRKPKPVTFKTKRTMKQVLEFGERINRTLIAAEEYCKNHE